MTRLRASPEELCASARRRRMARCGRHSLIFPKVGHRRRSPPAPSIATGPFACALSTACSGLNSPGTARSVKGQGAGAAPTSMLDGTRSHARCSSLQLALPTPRGDRNVHKEARCCSEADGTDCPASPSHLSSSGRSACERSMRSMPKIQLRGARSTAAEAWLLSRRG